MLENDLIIGTGSIIIKVESQEAKDNFIKELVNMSDKKNLIEEKNLTCGDCAAYPCFRTTSSDLYLNRGPFVERLFSEKPEIEEQFKKEQNKEASRPTGLCYQKVRECRQECDNFIQIDDSGKSPEFQIKGTCKRDNSVVNYDAECKFL